MSETAADKLFDTGIAHSLAEADISEVLFAVYGEDGFEEWTHDYYDRSIEVYGCTPSADAYDRLKERGFNIVWQHAHKQGEPSRLNCGCRAVRPA